MAGIVYEPETDEKRENSMNITVLYSLPTKALRSGYFLSAEDDTDVTARLVHRSLLGQGHGVTLLAVDEDSLDKISGIRADCIFNLIEWTGHDLPLALEAWKMLDALRIPYTGADAQSWRITTDKVLMKRAFDEHRLATSPWQVFFTGAEEARQFRYPVIVKLSLEHCGIGLESDSMVLDQTNLMTIVRKRLKRYRQPVIVEEYLPGMEFEVGMLQVEGHLDVFPSVANVYDQDSPVKFLTYDGRWQDNARDFVRYSVTMPKLPPQTRQAVERLCERTFSALRFQDYARFDIRLNSDGQPVLMEANSNPGLDDDPENGLTAGFHARGYTFDSFVWAIIASALWRAKKGI
jgi:D-alanine-D-alanine ligase